MAGAGGGGGSQGAGAYLRDEPAELRRLYTPGAPLAARSPREVEELVAEVSRRTGLPAGAAEYPVDPELLATTARALEEAVAALFGDGLRLEDGAAAQLDVLVGSRLLAPALRPYFATGPLAALEDAAAYAEVRGRVEAPREALLSYALGAWWGEWLVRHRRAAWCLFPPLRPVQAFPDAAALSWGTLCLHPFSHVCRKLSHPEEELAAKAGLVAPERDYLPPFPLIASPADAEHAFLSRLPARAQEALRLRREGRGEEAYQAFCRAIDESPGEPCLLAVAAQHALEGTITPAAEAWLRRVLELVPENPKTEHNLAVVLYQAGRGEEALALARRVAARAPQYSRGRITVAAMLLEAGRAAEARPHLEAVAARSDPGLAGEARELLARCGP